MPLSPTGIAIADCQELALTGTAALSTNAIHGERVVLIATAASFVRIGANPTATLSGTGNIFLPANVPIETDCQWSDKVSGITASTATLYIMPRR